MPTAGILNPRLVQFGFMECNEIDENEDECDIELIPENIVDDEKKDMRQSEQNILCLQTLLCSWNVLTFKSSIALESKLNVTSNHANILANNSYFNEIIIGMARHPSLKLELPSHIQIGVDVSYDMKGKESDSCATTLTKNHARVNQTLMD